MMLLGDILIILIALTLIWLVVAPQHRKKKVRFHLFATAMIDVDGRASYVRINEKRTTKPEAQALFDEWFADLGDAYLVSCIIVPTGEEL